ncbi:hypothetical protein CKA32_003498 [Geitlerinema sp. FC II]|nr:hypothetical protein CKA32_003498 [Geitlerinema sp. FC II]
MSSYGCFISLERFYRISSQYLEDTVLESSSTDRQLAANPRSSKIARIYETLETSIELN